MKAVAKGPSYGEVESPVNTGSYVEDNLDGNLIQDSEAIQL